MDKINLMGLEFENFLDCCICGEEDVIQYFYDTIKKTIRFYINYYLPDEKVKYVFDVRKVKNPDKDPEKFYTIEMCCPCCDEWFVGIFNIPNEYESTKGEGIMQPVYVPKEFKIDFDPSARRNSPS